jgi:hypothetical protein
VEISDESIQATTIDPLQTHSKSKSEAPLDLAALATLSSSIKRRSFPRWQQVVPIASLHGDTHNT